MPKGIYDRNKKSGGGHDLGAVGELHPTTNGAAGLIKLSEPYVADVRIVGTMPIMFHRWNVEAVAEKAAAAKGSKTKKSDDVDSYVYRMPDSEPDAGCIAIPGVYFLNTIIGAAKYLQDPRSPRKSAQDLFKAGLLVSQEYVPILSARGGGVPQPVKEWDFLDQRRVVVQRNGITRQRPAFHKGWAAEFTIEVLLPEYIASDVLAATITNAGRLGGMAELRPTYGRYQLALFGVRQLDVS